MSLIFTEWHCNNCNKTTEQYVSFGNHFEIERDIIYKWICPICQHINEFNLIKIQNNIELIDVDKTGSLCRIKKGHFYEY